MTQGLQLSSLLGNTDTALLSGSSALDNGAVAEGGAAFSQLLNDASQTATSGLPTLKARKLPAAISSLSDISKALIAAADAKAGQPETDDALSANLLQQIAFSEQSQHASQKQLPLATDAAIAAAEAADIVASLTTEAAAGDGEAESAQAQSTAGTSQHAAQSASKSAADSTALGGKVTSALVAEQADTVTDIAGRARAEQDSLSAKQRVFAKDATDVATASQVKTATAATADSDSKAQAATAAGLPVDDTLARSEGKAVLAAAMAQQPTAQAPVETVKANADKVPVTPALQDTRIASQLRQELQPGKRTNDKADNSQSLRFNYEPEAELADTALTAANSSAKATGPQVEAGAVLRQCQDKPQAKDNAKLPVMPPETDSVQADTTAQQTLLQEPGQFTEMTQSGLGAATEPAEGSAIQDNLTTTVKTTTPDSETNIQAAARELTSTGGLQVNAATAPDDAVPAQAARTADPVNQSKNGDERSGLTTATDKTGAFKADTGSGRSGSEQSASQQQQQQPGHFTEPAANTLQHKVAETSGMERGVFNAESLTGRVDSVFGQSAQAGIGAVAAKTATSQVSVAEQLKQRLNLQHQDAAGQLRERVNLMLRQNIQVAEIRLDPVGLGQMQIKVDMQQDQAQVQFVVQQPQAKELLEQHMPRLRDMLQQQGITLSEGNVQQQSQSQQQERQLAQQDSEGRGQNRQHAGNSDEHGAEQGNTVQLKVPVSDRMVDYYA